MKTKQVSKDGNGYRIRVPVEREFSNPFRPFFALQMKTAMATGIMAFDV
ncbi:MAG: hypothetical protein HGA80_00730 [Candidatus Omnitrophica bacterium]|nr:hypothetical protein [Candidatus Omnitrophota bacterium]